MYRNPLYNGDYSEYNSLKNQQNKSIITDKYSSRKLKQGIATEKIKFYEYLTYQQPVLDELIYVAERMRNENIQKQKEDFDFIQKLKQEREIRLKKASELQKDNKEIKEELFGEVPIPKDETPTITSELEMDFPDDYNKVMEELIKKGNVQLMTPSETRKDEMKRRRDERNKIVQQAIETVKEDMNVINTFFKKQKETTAKDQKDNIIEAVAYEEEKRGKGRTPGQPNEQTIEKYQLWKEGTGKKPKKKQIEMVEAWLNKTTVASANYDQSILTGVPTQSLESPSGNKKSKKGQKKK